MIVVQTGTLPEQTLTIQYAHRGAYTDCLFIDMSGNISLEAYIEAFYTTPLIKVERAILSLLARKPSTDENAKQLSLGHTQKFSAWTVENRLPNQILLCDFTNTTRSWLMVEETVN